MKNKIDKFNAPDGYIAIKAKDCCKGCAFDKPEVMDCGNDRPCCSCDRKDKQTVIFIEEQPDWKYRVNK